MKRIYINIITLSLCLFGLLLTACSNDDDQYADVSNSYITTSFGTNPVVLPKGMDMAFIDLSRGVTARTWHFPTGTVLKSSQDTISSASEDVVTVHFTTPGEYDVIIDQTYVDKVWVDLVQQESNQYTDTISVTVLDSIQANFTLYEVNAQKQLTIEDDALNEVVAGHTVTLTSNATGAPSSNDWKITREDGKTYDLSGQEASFKFSVPGTYSITYFCSSVFGESEKTVNNIIKVVASTEPVTLDNMSRSGSDEITLTYSRALGDGTDCPMDAFNLNVTNNGIEQTVTIKNFIVDENLIVLKLTGDIYNSDDISISYDASIGDLMTADGMKLDSFTDQPMTDFEDVNLLASSDYDYDFENNPASDWVSAGWGGNWEKYSLAISESIVHSGTHSLQISQQAGGGACFKLVKSGIPVTFATTKGMTYQLSLWVYAEDLGGNVDGQPNLAFYWQTNTAWDTPQLSTDAENIGKWVHLTAEVTGSNDVNAFMIRANNEANAQSSVIYLDDLSLIQIEKRQ